MYEHILQLCLILNVRAQILHTLTYVDLPRVLRYALVYYTIAWTNPPKKGKKKRERSFFLLPFFPSIVLIFHSYTAWGKERHRGMNFVDNGSCILRR